MIEKDIDVVVIGGGPGGYVAAIHASHLGARVVLIEKDEVGGTCLNRGCIPTKALIRSAEVLVEMKEAPDYGIEIAQFKPNFKNIMQRKNSLVEKLTGNVMQLMEFNKIKVCKGSGRITAPGRVEVNGETINTRNIIIATGSEPVVLPVPGADLPGVVTTDDILELDEIPGSLVVIGGGYVGVEIANIFSALGSKVTIVEALPTLLSTLDREIGRRFTPILRKQGIKVKTGQSVKAIKRNGDILKVFSGDEEEGEVIAEGDLVLMATGRMPYTGNLGLPGLGIKMDRRSIVVNEQLETNVDGIFAIGDTLGKHMLAHVASHQGIVAAENALGNRRTVDYRGVPFCVFTMPEIAGVGMTEEEARSRGIEYKVSKFPLGMCGKAVVLGKTEGMVKMICNKSDGEILGLHIIGTRASELIAYGALAIQKKATAGDICQTLHSHPTLSEAILEAAMGQVHAPIHLQKLRAL